MKRRSFLKGLGLGTAMSIAVLSTRKVGMIAAEQHEMTSNPHKVTLSDLGGDIQQDYGWRLEFGYKPHLPEIVTGERSV